MVWGQQNYVFWTNDQNCSILWLNGEILQTVELDYVDAIQKLFMQGAEYSIRKNSFGKGQSRYWPLPDHIVYANLLNSF